MPSEKINLSQSAIKINTALTNVLIEKIQLAGGEIAFSDFMDTALYTSHFGYYQNNLHTFGEKGDFVTAPEIGTVFGRAVFSSIKSLVKDKLTLLEFGAGTGALAETIINECHQHQLAVEYFILEPSSQLQALQKEKLQLFENTPGTNITWLKQFPEQFTGVVIANEVIDAMAVDRIRKTESGWRNLNVAIEEQEFVWKLGDEVSVETLPPVIRECNSEYPTGYTCEINRQEAGWLNSMSDSLISGHLLIIDYGYPQHEYYHPQRIEGTLACYSRHQVSHNPFERLGLQDISAHVDFTALANSALKYGFEVAGFTTQAGFILESGVLEKLNPESQVETYELSRQLQILMAPGQMGEVVKVIQLAKNTDKTATGFKLQDHLHRL